MASFSFLGIGLSFLFGCILLGLIAEFYYLLWWKKRIINTGIENHYSTYAQELSFLFCWKKPNSVNRTQELTASVRNPNSNVDEQDLELGTGNDLLLKGFGEGGVESELMRMHNLCGPPRFLFTIKEETKEDLESEDGKSRCGRSRKGSRTKSLSDLILTVDTPFLTPLSSPPLKTQHLDSYNHHGFNPLFESLTEAELNRLKSSPPPKFKFLKDAEEKLIRKLMEEAERKALKNDGFIEDSDVKVAPKAEKDVSFIAGVVGKKEEELRHQMSLSHSTASQVLPLASTPPIFRQLEKNSIVQ